ncbi:MAG TPA: CoA-acylating methylmalonate-semialdehyde dehydrogenase [Actinomycetota bacterium]|nr:CoA-acylating methylmalonate-semialdehyde dehydrogenase [Actinomycetota bacterium]
MTRSIGHWIGGREVHDDSGRAGDVFDPARGAVTARVAFAAPEIVDRAVRTAADAQRAWAETSLAERARVMFAFRAIVDARREELAAIVSAEHGKVRSDALGEIQRGLEVVEFACGLPHLLKGEFSENVSSGVDSYSMRQPVGVVAGITPFNFPVMVPMWMYPVALACGNAFVLKPSEKDPSAANVVARMLADAGLPDGVFDVVHGDKVAVDALLAHPLVAAVSSVGSTPVARYVYETAARHGKRVQALGGAKNHMVVLPDADMDLAADAMVSAGYGSSGQRCMAISAVVAVGDAGDALVERARERIVKVRIGPADDDGADMGPVVTGAHRDKVLSYVEEGVRAGAELVVDGRDVEVPGYESGFFLGPCLFDRVAPEMSIYTDEIFGPVLVTLRVDTLDDALALIESSPYGNGAAIFTADGRAARRFQHEADAGMVGINVPIPVPMAYYSFGGWKHSLFGDSHVHGREGVSFYTRGKVVTSRWPAPPEAGVRLGFPSG